MTPPKRSLFLHLSALSDAEYSSYVEALRDIFDDGELSGVSDEELETMSIALPVVRAWMKGRFRDVHQVDMVLQLFAQQIPQKEMSGGQLLAALRLLMHVRHGGEVSEGNVFIQAEPSSPTVSRHPTFATEVKTEPPTTDGAPMSPPHSGFLEQTNPFTRRSTLSRLAPPNDENADHPRRASLSSAPELPPSNTKPRIDGVGVPPGSTNPFLQRAKTHSGSYGQPNSTAPGRTPPLPPRKPAHMSSSSAPSGPPPIPAKPLHPNPARRPLPVTSSNSSSSLSSSPTAKSPPPLPRHRITPLMQQSLLASRVGASLKRAQEEAGRTRVLEVIRSSSDASSSRNGAKERDRTQSSSRSPDKGTRRPVPQPPPRTGRAIPPAKSDSVAPSIASLAEVAGARLARSPSRTRPDSPDNFSSSSDKEEQGSSRNRHFSSDQFSPPPTHPARRPSAHVSGHSRHLRSPSYQPYISQQHPAPAASSINKSSSSSGVAGGNHRSPSPSPSSSPVSPTHPRPVRSQSLRQTHLPHSEQYTESNFVPQYAQRKRPESAHFTTRPNASEFDRDLGGDIDEGASPFANSSGARRRSDEETGGGMVSSMAARFNAQHSPDKDKEREPNAFSSFQRTFNALQQKAHPAITRARFKAEAGLLAPRRGFVPNTREYHLAGEDGDRLVSQNSTGDEGGMDLAPTTDDDFTSGEDTVRARGRSQVGNAKQYTVERDNLKLPEGEGWTRL